MEPEGLWPSPRVQSSELAFRDSGLDSDIQENVHHVDNHYKDNCGVDGTMKKDGYGVEQFHFSGGSLQKWCVNKLKASETANGNRSLRNSLHWEEFFGNFSFAF